MNKLPIYTLYTPSHEVLLQGFFLPSLPKNMDLRLHSFDTPKMRNFRDNGFLRAIRQKLDLVVESIRENDNDLIVWADVDIQFFGPLAPVVRGSMKDYDLCFQT